MTNLDFRAQQQWFLLGYALYYRISAKDFLITAMHKSTLLWERTTQGVNVRR